MSDEPLPADALTRREWRRVEARKAAVAPEAAAEHPVAPVILVVCTGNVCRSPLAETLLRQRMRGIDVTVHSAGTRALVGAEMVGLSQELAIRYGAAPDEVDAHRARWLVEQLADDADLILAMSRTHRTAAVELSPKHLRHTFTAREFARLSQGLNDEDIRIEADAAGPSPRARLSAVIALVARQRGTTAPQSTHDDDVIDPYRRERDVYEASARQLVPAVDEVARVLRATLVAR